jgi:hypothetical protein
MELLLVQFPSTSCCFLSHRYKYSLCILFSVLIHIPPYTKETKFNEIIQQAKLYFCMYFKALILSFEFDANAAADDATSTVICNIIGYTQSLGGPMINVAIIGTALIIIFGRMPWPALFALGAFTAVFVGAPALTFAVLDKMCTNKRI